jgi:SAM-dependent methyltransferase
VERSADVKTYFTQRAQLFDALYEDEGLLSRGFNQVFRRPMFQRYVHTLAALDKLQGKRILDVGCGSGRYAVELAKGGATVVGVDFSEEMLKMSRERAREAGVEDRTQFIAADFAEWGRNSTEQFDASFAMGVFDYIEDAAGFLKTMAARSNEVIASFPSPTPPRAPLRKLRYALRNCPLFFYKKADVERLYRGAGLRIVSIKRIGLAGYWVHGVKNGA